jgi:hypothetical protein
MTFTRFSFPVAAGFALASMALAQKGPPLPPPPGGGICPPGNTADLCIPLDGSFSIAPINNFGAVAPCFENDDQSTAAIPLLFPFDLFGTLQNSVFINNNGNVSFGSSFGTFTASGFPVAGFPMVAPFWGDVDTRATNGGVVWFRSEPNRFTVTWDHVGYYSAHGDLLSTFQLIMTDGTDPLVGIGNNVCFCYGDMQWTTGDASGGSGGFGGTPATVGVNEGNGVDFFQIGRFDHPGNDYDGPGGNADGVDFLDGQRQCFQVGSATNTPPIFINPPQGCLMASAGVPLVFQIGAIAPEAVQSTTMTVNDGGLANFSCVIVNGGPGGQATATCTFIPGGAQVGQFNVIFTACDNFSPPACTSITVCILVAECHQLFGRGGEGSQINLFGHLYDSQITNVRMHFPVTMTDHPSIPVPNLAAGQIQFSMETLMYNPQAFPNNPSQWSNRLRVTVLPGQVVTGQLQGTLNGIHQGLQTFTNPQGQVMMTFPFAIDGM